MSHNTAEFDKRFQLQWCETNLHYLLGEESTDAAHLQKIAYMRAEIARLTVELAKIG